MHAKILASSAGWGRRALWHLIFFWEQGRRFFGFDKRPCACVQAFKPFYWVQVVVTVMPAEEVNCGELSACPFLSPI